MDVIEVKHEIMESSSAQASASTPNPWDVDNVNHFLFYCCPECPFSAKAVVIFKDHAVDNHPKGKRFFEDHPGTKGKDTVSVPSLHTEDGQAIVVKADPSDVHKVVNLLKPTQTGSKRGRKRKAETVRMPIQQPQAEEPEVDPLMDASPPGGDDFFSPEPVEPAEPIKPKDESKQFQCDLCPEGYNKLYALAMHVNLFHVFGKGRDVECPGCKKVFPTAKRLKCHIEHVHEGVAPKVPRAPILRCEVEGCSYETKIAKHLEAHNVKVHGPKEDNVVHQCPEAGCDYETTKASNLKSHLYNRHSEKKEQCESCGKTFRTKGLLNEHMHTTHLKLKSHICDKCGKGFDLERQMKSHQALSSCDILARRDMTYSCDKCPNNDTFNNIKGYVWHYRRTHKAFPTNIDTSSLKVFYCDQCPEVYISNLSLGRHKRRIHEGKGKARVRAKKVKDPCTYCGKLVPKGLPMTEHVKSKHENDTPFKCEQCPRAYATVSFLRTHVISVHRKMTCKICGKEICNKFWYRRHMAKEHNVVDEDSFQCDRCVAVFDTLEAKKKHMMKQHSYVVLDDEQSD